MSEKARLAVQVGEKQLQEARALLSTLQHEQARVSVLVCRQGAVVQHLAQALEAGGEVAAEVGHLGALPGLADIVAEHESAVPVDQPEVTAPEQPEEGETDGDR